MAATTANILEIAAQQKRRELSKFLYVAFFSVLQTKEKTAKTHLAKTENIKKMEKI